MDKVYFHGNNKTADEIELAVKKIKVGNIIVDNIYELDSILTKLLRNTVLFRT